MSGGFRGIVKNPTSLDASGRWTVQEVFEAIKAETWANFFSIEYLVIAGGGSGGFQATTAGVGAGGAGGYRTNVVGASSGGGASAEAPLFFTKGVSFTVTVGAGAPAKSGSTVRGDDGSNSVFSTITCEGGGGGGAPGFAPAGRSGGSGGSPGASSTSLSGGSGTAGQGYAGGDNFASTTASQRASGGGGGAGAVGVNAIINVGGAGGAGVASSITGTSVTRAGGGGGAGATPGAGGAGGGGDASDTTAVSGAVNTGGGGGGARSATAVTSGAGGSGIVILRYPATVSLTVGAGLTSSTDGSTVPGYKITTFTAGSDTVTIG